MTKIGGFVRAALAATVLALASGLAMGPGALAGSNRDVLYVGDGVAGSVLPSDNQVEVFDAITGAFRGSLTPSGLLGPRGIVTRGNLFLVNQNVNTDFTGEVLRFNAAAANPAKRLVPADTPDAPFAPRGMILWNSHLFVANVFDPNQPGLPGGVMRYSPAGDLVDTLRPPPGPIEFHPFGVVIGPDGLLYVSSRPSLFSGGPAGQVLQFDPSTGNFIKVFIDRDDTSGACAGQLNGPEGLVFGPNGRLYVTSLRTNVLDTDKILIFAGPGGADPGACIGKLDLDEPDDDENRSTAAALLFGPGGDLFVPITNAFPPPIVGKDRGAIRRYRVGCQQIDSGDCFSNFVDPGGQLGAGWYLTFGKTKPDTLAYGG